MRWRSRVGATPLDLAVRGIAANLGPQEVPDLYARKLLPCVGQGACDACFLEDGIRAMKRPLKSYTMPDLETFEYYPATPPETELTGTLEERFQHVPGCEKDGSGNHPAWYVVWLKGSR